jgi:phosphoribosyl-AMP cyclohydrolase / phosphoribosyl-ATP pyrophosphohydrolase
LIIPSIDLMNGSAVQLIGGRERAIDAGDPMPIAERFALAGEVAVIDLDAALGQGSNRETIERLLAVTPCRVGGGVRDERTAIRWLDAGAAKIILGTAAQPKLLRNLPRDRVIAALDAEHGEVVVDGWRTKTGRSVKGRIEELRECVSGFLITFVEREGRMEGIDLEAVKPLIDAAGDCRVTIAGGVRAAEEIAALHTIGADAQVGMAIYTGRLNLADAIVAPMRSDRDDGLWPTVVVDERGTALGLAYSNLQSVREAIERKRGVYHSRSRGLWIKGESSGALQELKRIDLDCDADCLRFTVTQRGAGFCHQNTATCWGDLNGLSSLIRRIEDRLANAPPGSYTKRLIDEPQLLKAKLLEEAGELAEARTADDVRHETADLLYFALTAMAQAGVSLVDVERELDRRAMRVTRRSGNAKPQATTREVSS